MCEESGAVHDFDLHPHKGIHAVLYSPVAIPSDVGSPLDDPPIAGAVAAATSVAAPSAIPGTQQHT